MCVKCIFELGASFHISALQTNFILVASFLQLIYSDAIPANLKKYGQLFQCMKYNYKNAGREHLGQLFGKLHTALLDGKSYSVF